MSTRVNLFGKKTAKSEYAMDHIIAEGTQVVPLVWLALFTASDIRTVNYLEHPVVELCASIASAKKNLKSQILDLEAILGSKGECHYAASLLEDALSLTDNKFVAIDLSEIQAMSELDSDVGDFEQQLRSALSELAGRKRLDDLSSLSAVDGYATIKMSKVALAKDAWTKKDWEAIEYLLGYPVIDKCRWQKLVIAAAKRFRE